jgi:alkylation response protein AidB-like acyl-CoA dehydrogenase/nitroreductase/NAD-dependent dihydropyrimidine dehydrogenase PreA subunit
MGLRELNIDLTKEHVALWKETKKFVSEVWRPAAIELDRLPDPGDVIAEGSVLWDVFRKTYELGYHTMAIPEEFGGTRGDVLGGALMAEAMGWAASDLAVSWAVCTTPFAYAMFSPQAEMQELTRKFCADQEGKLTGCWAITEPDHGSDWILFDAESGKNPACAPQVVAQQDGDEYVINGQKSSWVSNGSFASHAALWLTLDPSQGMGAGGIAVLPLDLPGITRGAPLNKLGQRALNQGEIFFDNVRIPKYMMVAQDPMTFEFMSNAQLGLANGWMGLLFGGTALAAFEEALEYAKNRVQGAKAIIEHQNIKLKLFDMFVSVEAARSLARRVAVYNSQLLDQMQPPAVHYAMASKILSTETAFKVASEAIQIFGGYGLSKEFHIEKIFRDARAAMIEDGSNETLAIGGADKLAAGRGTWVVQDAAAQTTPGAVEQEGPSWEELEPMFRPKGVHMGVMKADAEKCTQCGLCLENCPFRAWELDEAEVPQMKAEYECFSCYNCMVVCPTGAISIDQSYYVEDGSFYETQGGPLPAKMPDEPKDAEGNADEWTVVERTIMERRSVRNFKPDPVPEHLLRRVLEAGRFAPSSGNCQPWKFIVVTNKALIDEMNESIFNIVSMLYGAYTNDAMVKGLIPVYQQSLQSGLFDPRIMLGGCGSIARKNGPVFLGAPVVILVACDDRSIGGPQIQAGICGQNMNLAAMSLGLGFCWIGFSQVIEMVPELKEKLGLQDPWKINTSMVLGYPKFQQEGIVPREFRPVTWFREGADGPVYEE